jgi:hypothetical protein
MAVTNFGFMGSIGLIGSIGFLRCGLRVASGGLLDAGCGLVGMERRETAMRRL